MKVKIAYFVIQWMEQV